MESQIAKFVERYRRTGSDDDKNAAIQELGIFLYTEMGRLRIRIQNEDRKSDFVTWLYPKLGTMIDRYDPARSRFETYIGNICRLYFRTFLRQQYRTSAEEAVFSDPEFVHYSEAESSETETEVLSRIAAVAESDPAYLIKKRTAHAEALRRKKILLLACKAAPFLNDQLIVQIGEITGYGENTIRLLTENLKKECFKKISQNLLYRQKRNYYFLRSRRCEIELSGLETGCSRYERLKKEYSYCRDQWLRCRNKTWTHSQVPSNRTIARITGICRGTVDSTLATAVRDGYS